jgi:hypothetical protein
MLQKSFDVVFPGTEQNRVRLFTSHLLKTFLQFIGVKQWHTPEIASKYHHNQSMPMLNLRRIVVAAV